MNSVFFELYGLWIVGAIVMSIALGIVLMSYWDRIRPQWSSAKIKLAWLGTVAGLTAAILLATGAWRTFLTWPDLLVDTITNRMFLAGMGAGALLLFGIQVGFKLYWPSWDASPPTGREDEIGPD